MAKSSGSSQQGGVVRIDTLGTSGGSARTGVPSGSVGYAQTSRETSERMQPASSRVVYEEIKTPQGGIIGQKPVTRIDVRSGGREGTITDLNTGERQDFRSDTRISAGDVSVPERGIKSYAEQKRDRIKELKKQYEQSGKKLFKGSLADYQEAYPETRTQIPSRQMVQIKADTTPKEALKQIREKSEKYGDVTILYNEKEIKKDIALKNAIKYGAGEFKPKSKQEQDLRQSLPKSEWNLYESFLKKNERVLKATPKEVQKFKNYKAIYDKINKVNSKLNKIKVPSNETTRLAFGLLKEQAVSYARGAKKISIEVERNRHIFKNNKLIFNSLGEYSKNLKDYNKAIQEKNMTKVKVIEKELKNNQFKVIKAINQGGITKNVLKDKDVQNFLITSGLLAGGSGIAGKALKGGIELYAGATLGFSIGKAVAVKSPEARAEALSNVIMMGGLYGFSKGVSKVKQIKQLYSDLKLQRKILGKEYLKKMPKLETIKKVKPELRAKLKDSLIRTISYGTGKKYGTVTRMVGLRYKLIGGKPQYELVTRKALEFTKGKKIQKSFKFSGTEIQNTKGKDYAYIVKKNKYYIGELSKGKLKNLIELRSQKAKILSDLRNIKGDTVQSIKLKQKLTDKLLYKIKGKKLSNLEIQGILRPSKGKFKIKEKPILRIVYPKKATKGQTNEINQFKKLSFEKDALRKELVETSLKKPLSGKLTETEYNKILDKETQLQNNIRNIELKQRDLFQKIKGKYNIIYDGKKFIFKKLPKKTTPLSTTFKKETEITTEPKRQILEQISKKVKQQKLSKEPTKPIVNIEKPIYSSKFGKFYLIVPEESATQTIKINVNDLKSELQNNIQLINPSQKYIYIEKPIVGVTTKTGEELKLNLDIKGKTDNKIIQDLTTGLTSKFEQRQLPIIDIAQNQKQEQMLKQLIIQKQWSKYKTPKEPPKKIEEQITKLPFLPKSQLKKAIAQIRKKKYTKFQFQYTPTLAGIDQRALRTSGQFIGLEVRGNIIKPILVHKHKRGNLVHKQFVRKHHRAKIKRKYV